MKTYSIDTVPGWTDAQRAAMRARVPDADFVFTTLSFERLMALEDQSDALDREMDQWPTQGLPGERTLSEAIG